MERFNGLGNIQYDENEGFAIFSLNSKIYPLDIVYSAAYILIDKMYVILDGNPDTEIMVEIRKKDPKQNLKNLVMDFNNELLNYAVYKQQSEKNKNIREIMLQRILLTNSPEYFDLLSKQKALQENKDFDDPKGIMKTWDDAHPEEAAKQDKDAKNC